MHAVKWLVALITLCHFYMSLSLQLPQRSSDMHNFWWGHCHIPRWVALAPPTRKLDNSNWNFSQIFRISLKLLLDSSQDFYETWLVQMSDIYSRRKNREELVDISNEDIMVDIWWFAWDATLNQVQGSSWSGHGCFDLAFVKFGISLTVIRSEIFIVGSNDSAQQEVSHFGTCAISTSFFQSLLNSSPRLRRICMKFGWNKLQISDDK